VYDFWSSPGASRATGNKSDIKRMRTGPKQFVTHAVFVLEKTQTEVFLAFRETILLLKFANSHLKNFKPFFVQPIRPKDKQTCYCRYHIEIRGIFKSCMDFRRKVLKNNPILNGEFKVYENLNELVAETLCQNSENVHKLKCLKRNCENCGVNNLNLMEEEKVDKEQLPDVQ
jgi:hypothetical protein